MIFINQVTGELFSELIDCLSAAPKSSHFLIAGISYKKWENVTCLRSCALQKNNSFKRIVTWLTFTTQTFFHLLRHGKEQSCLFVTNPPMVIWLGPFFKKYYGCKYSLLIYDIYPDVLISMGILSPNSFIAALWRRLNAFAMHHAEHVITLGEGMASTLRKQLADLHTVRITVIENWVDTGFLHPIKREENPIISELHLDQKFIVLYAGSFGATHGVSTIIESADILKDYHDIHFFLIGGGTEEKKIRNYLREANLNNLTLLPFQPKDLFLYFSASADISLILLKSNAEKAIMPSKLYSALAIGSAVVASVANDCDLAEHIKKYQYGIVLPPEDPQNLSEGILYLKEHPQQLLEYKKNARMTAVKLYSKTKQCQKYYQLLL